MHLLFLNLQLDEQRQLILSEIETHFPTRSEHNGFVLVIFQTEGKTKMYLIKADNSKHSATA